ncbi:MAG TPA: hypothetical protein PKW06_07115 [Cyclobacteriaceae bacterium]|nr:hypothetical protein [Cyclobacteriaceae bacterium]
MVRFSLLLGLSIFLSPQKLSAEAGPGTPVHYAFEEAGHGHAPTHLIEAAAFDYDESPSIKKCKLPLNPSLSGARPSRFGLSAHPPQWLCGCRVCPPLAHPDHLALRVLRI